MPLVQAGSATTPGPAASLTVVVTGVAAGNSLVVYVSQAQSNANRTYTAVSDLDGALTQSVYLAANSRVVCMFYKHNVSAGTHSIVITPDLSANFDGLVEERSGLDTSASPITGTFDSVTANTHYCAAVGSIDTTTGADICCACTTAGNVTATVAGTGFTKTANPGSVNIHWQYREAAAAVTDERGEWTSTGTARDGLGSVTAFPLAPGGAAFQAAWARGANALL